MTNIEMGFLLGVGMALAMLTLEQVYRWRGKEREEEARIGHHLVWTLILGTITIIFLPYLSSPEEVASDAQAVVVMLITYLFVLYMPSVFKLIRKRRKRRRGARP